MSRPAWRNRIVGSGEEDPEQLLANPANWRVHPQAQQDALAGVLAEVGWVQQVLVNQRTGHLIDGHLRVSLALRRHEPSIPVLYLDLDPAEELLVLATLDPLAALAATDREQLDGLLRQVSTGEAAVQALLSQLAQDAGVVPPDTFNPEDEWQDMPEYEHDDLTPAFRVVVNFATLADLDAFEQRIQQSVPRTKAGAFSIWFPAAEQLTNLGLAYVAPDDET